MKKIIIAISMMLAMNIFLAVPALAENFRSMVYMIVMETTRGCFIR